MFIQRLKLYIKYYIMNYMQDIYGQFFVLLDIVPNLSRNVLL